MPQVHAQLHYTSDKIDRGGLANGVPDRVLPAAEEHLRKLTAREQRRVLDTVEALLRHQPLVETRQRKPMRPNPLAPWELRIADLRVYHEVRQAPRPIVLVLAVGRKQRDRVYIGGWEIRL